MIYDETKGPDNKSVTTALSSEAILRFDQVQDARCKMLKMYKKR